MSGHTVCVKTTRHRLYQFIYHDFIITGVLMWEVFTCGKMPYGRLKNTEVVERVQRGIILERPKACAKEIYEVSLHILRFSIFHIC